jgi:Lipocalin-like domain
MKGGEEMGEIDRSKLVGSWKIISAEGRFVDSNEVVQLLGPAPLGYCMFDENGRWIVVTTAAQSATVTDAECARWFRQRMVAFSARYEIREDTILAKVDVAWNPALVGAQIPRQVELDGNRMTITQPAWEHPFFPGRKMVGVIVWEREN